MGILKIKVMGDILYKARTQLKDTWGAHPNWLINICFFTFISLYSISFYLYIHGFYTVGDLFFDSDVGVNLTSFSHGWGRHAVSHPLIEVISLPFRLISEVLLFIGLVSDAEEFRVYLGLLVSPMVSALNVLVFYIIINSIGIKETKILSLVFALSFSNVIFGMIPESFSLSCFFISCMILMYVKPDNYPTRWAIWLLVAVASTGITITNIVIFFIIYGFYNLKNTKLGYWHAVGLSALTSALAFLLVLMTYYLLHWLLEYPRGFQGSPEWILRYVRFDLHTMANNILHLINASINAVASYDYLIRDDWECEKTFCEQILTINTDVNIIKQLILVVLFFSVIYLAYDNVSRLSFIHSKPLLLLCLTLLLFNFSFHSFFGREMFLYSQHWITAMSILLSIAFHTNRKFLVILISVQAVAIVMFFYRLIHMPIVI